MRLTVMKGFWDTEIISGTTINYLPTPSVGPLSLNFLLYIFIIIITAYILIKKRDHSGKSVKKALLIAFGAAFFLFTLRMDLNWIALMKADSENLFNKPIKERFQYLDGNNFYEFIEFVRASIPENESIRDEFSLKRRLKRVRLGLSEKSSYRMRSLKSPPSWNFSKS